MLCACYNLAMKRALPPIFTPRRVGDRVPKRRAANRMTGRRSGSNCAGRFEPDANVQQPAQVQAQYPVIH